MIFATMAAISAVVFVATTPATAGSAEYCDRYARQYGAPLHPIVSGWIVGQPGQTRFIGIWEVGGLFIALESQRSYLKAYCRCLTDVGEKDGKAISSPE